MLYRLCYLTLLYSLWCLSKYQENLQTGSSRAIFFVNILWWCKSFQDQLTSLTKTKVGNHFDNEDKSPTKKTYGFLRGKQNNVYYFSCWFACHMIPRKTQLPWDHQLHIRYMSNIPFSYTVAFGAYIYYSCFSFAVKQFVSTARNQSDSPMPSGLYFSD